MLEANVMFYSVRACLNQCNLTDSDRYRLTTRRYRHRREWKRAIMHKFKNGSHILPRVEWMMFLGLFGGLSTFHPNSQLCLQFTYLCFIFG